MAGEREIRLWSRQREGVRTNCTADINDSMGYLGADAETSTADIQAATTVLKDYRSALAKFDVDILLHIEDDDEATAEVQAAAAYDRSVLKHISALSALLESRMSVAVRAAVVAAGSVAGDDRPHSPGHTGSYMSAGGRGKSVNLPKLHMAKFGGDPLKWAEFWDSFSTTIHVNGDLSDVEKFKYLRSFLVGDALRLVDGYRLTSANYNQAVESLSERFGNEQLAVFSHFESMLALPVANHDTHQLQAIYDECEKHIRSLVALGRDEETFGQVFTPIILSKLPVYVKMELHRRNGSKPWQLSNLREGLREEIRAREYSQRTFGGSGSSSGSANRSDRQHQQQGSGDHIGKQQHQTSKQPFGRRHSGHQATSAALVTHDKPSTIRCAFCGETHYSDQCRKYPDVDSRRRCLANRCYICFSDKHGVKGCQNRRSCVHCGKQGHHRSLCYAKFQSGRSGPNASLNVSEYSGNMGSVEPAAGNSTLLSHGETAILQTALCSVQGSSTSVARILLDTGSSRTFITKDVSNRIRARPRGKEVTSIAGFTSTKRKTATYDTVEFDVILKDGGKRTLTANVVPTISCPIQKWPLDVQANPTLLTMNLAEPLIASPQAINIDILVGTDYYYDFVGNERLEFPDGLILLSTSLGLVATGRVRNSNRRDTGVTSLHVDACPEAALHVERFWSLEDIGVKGPIAEQGDEEALATFNSTIKFEEGRYQVRLPFKSDERELPENKQLAVGRLRSQLKRIGSNEEVLGKYNDIIQDQLSKGIIEVAPSVPTGDKVHYLPHHGVITPNKATTKLRVVYDASAKASKSSPSLNDCLNRGPVILDDLCSLLIKFRLHPIGLVSDIEKAFLQIGLQECDRDVTRFFWVNDITKPAEGDNLKILRFCRVLFGAVASPFLLGGVIKHHLNKSAAPVAADIESCVYVDNIITGKRATGDAIGFYKGAKKLFAEASMNLREWFTNSTAVRDAIKPADRGQSTETKVLGITWDTTEDTLSCASFVVQKGSVNTKRLMLKYLAKVFDPCGYFSAVTVAGKLLIQKLWQAKYDWDDPLPDDITAEWAQCCDSLQKIATHTMPRCYNVDTGGDGVQYNLHCFCDASGKAYAAIVYLTVTTGKGTSSNIVFAKSRVGPIKQQLTIPRMELMAVVVGVRILAFVKSALGLPILTQYIWSDSQCVLHWVAKSSVETVFVRNRITEIKSHKDVTFRYVPTAVNPADLSSRGCSFDNLTNNPLWWHGPQWLVNPTSQWPNNPIPSVDHSANTEDIDDVPDTVVNLADGAAIQPLAPVDRYSSLGRLLRVTSWIKRFVNNIRGQSRRMGPLTAAELMESRLYWDRRTQLEHFYNILSAPEDGKANHLVRQFDLLIDDTGLIRCGGRLGEAGISSEAKHPKLLPKSCHYTDLVVLDCHKRLMHAGISHTLAQVRQQYWVVHGRGQVKRVIKRCHICTIAHGGPYHYPDPPPLPDFRVKRQKPFSTVGIDYLGPLYVKSGDSCEHTKVWICLFTCAITRAIHLEVVDNLTASLFVMGLRRFVATFGKPTLIISDNAKHFHKTNQHLARVWQELQRSAEIQDWASTQGIGWKFIVELSPWMGGFYERMVGVAKSALKKSLDNRCVSRVELQTLVAEISGIVNSRPLIYVDADNEQTALTPSHFLGGPHSALPSVNIDIDEYSPRRVTNNDLVELWRRSNTILNNFWHMWQNQYLLSLRERGYHFKQRNTGNTNPSLGDVVIVKDNLPRKSWRMGRITSLPLGRDGQCRSAVIQLGNRNTINRPLRLLFPLETGCGASTLVPGSSTNPQPVIQRPRRRAAIEAEQRFRENDDVVSSSDDNSSVEL